MRIAINEVVDAFGVLFVNLLNRDFAKSAGFEHYSESELLHIVRAFLLGWFGKVEPEIASSLPGCVSSSGRIDFRVGDVAVELAVRKYGDKHKRKLCAKENETEVKKLLRHNGPSLLVLFDFSRTHLSGEDLEEYRVLPSLGRGNWRTSAFHVVYFHRDTKTDEKVYTKIMVSPAAAKRAKLAA
jgi:hypothetical protein